MSLLFLLFTTVPCVLAQCERAASCVDCLGLRCHWAMNRCARACPLGGFNCKSPGDKCNDRCEGLTTQCSGRGTCNSDESMPLCTCNPGWIGWQCDAPSNGCLRDGDCRSGEYCGAGGRCQPKLAALGNCARGAECKDGYRCVGQPSGSAVCIKDANVGDNCMRNEHCTPFYQRCVQHKCVDVTAQARICNLPRDCPGHFDTPHTTTCINSTCQYISAVSEYPCRDDPDCYDDETCSSGKCATNLPSCRWDADCKVIEQCRGASCINPVGTTCRTDQDCLPAVCIQGMCQSPRCTRDSDCRWGTFCVQSRCLSVRPCRQTCGPGEACVPGNSPVPNPRGQADPSRHSKRHLLETDQKAVMPRTKSLPSFVRTFHRYDDPTDSEWNPDAMVCRCASLGCRAHGPPCQVDSDCDTNYACRAGICLDLRFGTMWPTPNPTPFSRH